MLATLLEEPAPTRDEPPPDGAVMGASAMPHSRPAPPAPVPPPVEPDFDALRAAFDAIDNQQQQHTAEPPPKRQRASPGPTMPAAVMHMSVPVPKCNQTPQGNPVCTISRREFEHIAGLTGKPFSLEAFCPEGAAALCTDSCTPNQPFALHEVHGQHV